MKRLHLSNLSAPGAAAVALSCALLAACGGGLPAAPAPNTALPPTAAPAASAIPTHTAAPQATAITKKIVPPTPQAAATSAGAAVKPTAATQKTVAAPTPQPAATKPAAQPTPVVGITAPGIQVKPASAKFGALTSTQSTMYLTLDGKAADGKAIKGGMTVALADDIKNKNSNIEIKGDLIGPLLSSQLRGFSPRGIGLFNLNGNTFARLDTLLTVCAKPKGGIPGLSDITSSLSVDGFLSMIGSDGAFPGKRVGNETLNGLNVQHYTLDLAAMKAAATKRGVTSWPELNRGELWLAQDGGYIVRMSIAGKGKLANLAGSAFDGSFDVILDTTAINQPVTITLPPACNRPIEI